MEPQSIRKKIMTQIHLTCPNCYNPAEVSVREPNFPCPTCGHSLQTGKLLRALSRFFMSAPDLSRPARFSIEAEATGQILAWLMKMPHGDAMFVGRGDWVRAGCPVTPAEFINAVAQLRDIPLAAISRLLSHPGLPDCLSVQRPSISKAVIANLNRGNATELERERLWNIRSLFPDPEASARIREAIESKPDEEGESQAAVGRAARRALECCDNLASKMTPS